MASRFLVLAPSFGGPSGAVSRALAQLNELGIDTQPVDLRSGVRRHTEVATSEIDPLSARLSAAAAHELAGDASVRLGFLGDGVLAVVASAAGARTAQTEGMVALFPDRNPLMPSSAPSLVISDAAPSELGGLQDAWGPAAQIILAAKRSYDVQGVVDPVTRLVADFASRNIMDAAPDTGLVAWMRARAVTDQYPLTAMERRRLISRLERELAASLNAKATPSQLRRLGRIAAVLAGLGAAQLAGGIAAHADGHAPAFSGSTLSVSMLGDDKTLTIDCTASDKVQIVNAQGAAFVATGPGASLTCDAVAAINVGVQLTSSLTADIHLNLDGFDPAGSEAAVGVVISGDDNANNMDIDVTGWANLEVNGLGGDDHVTVDGINAASGQTHVVDISAGAGNDVVNVGMADPLVVAGDLSLKIDGAGGDDRIEVGGLFAGRGSAAASSTGSLAWLGVTIDGGSGGDTIRVATADGINGTYDNSSVSVEINGDAGDDAIYVGDLLGSGDISVDADGGAGSDIIRIGAILAGSPNSSAGSSLWVSISAVGGSANDQISIGVTPDGSMGTHEVYGKSADVSISANGQGGSDTIRVAPIRVVGADAYAYVANNEGTDNSSDGGDLISFGDISVLGANASADVFANGSEGADRISFGEINLSGGGAAMDLMMHGGAGKDRIVVDGLRVGGSAVLGLDGTFGGGDDDLTINGINVTTNATLVFGEVQMGAGNDHVRLDGPGSILGAVLGAGSGGVLFGGGDSLGDTLSWADTYATFLGFSADSEPANNSLVTDWENFNQFTWSPPATGGTGGGDSSGPAASVRPEQGRQYGPAVLEAGGTLSTDTDETGEATPQKQAQVAVTLPEGGTVTIREVKFVADRVDESDDGLSGVSGADAASEFGALQIDLDIERSGDAPASIALMLDPTMFSPGADLSAMSVMLNGVIIADCPENGPNPATCIAKREVSGTGDLIIVIETTHNSVLSFAVAPTDQTARFCNSRSDGQSRFNDSSDSSPHKLAIECLADAGIIEGTSEGQFSPSGQLTRAQAASVIVRAADALGVILPTGENDEFSDVDGEGTHGSNVQRLAASGIIVGYGDGTFRGGASATRAQFAAMMTRMFEVATGTRPATVDVFADDDGLFLEQSMNEAAVLGLVKGVAPETSDPGGQISRAQAASIIGRFAGRLVAAGF
ncbi:MAG: hypothetical protein ACI867_001059 [Glaciecola sp.]|jgi:hypothetical protein